MWAACFATVHIFRLSLAESADPNPSTECHYNRPAGQLEGLLLKPPRSQPIVIRVHLLQRQRLALALATGILDFLKGVR